MKDQTLHLIQPCNNSISQWFVNILVVWVRCIGCLFEGNATLEVLVYVFVIFDVKYDL